MDRQFDEEGVVFELNDVPSYHYPDDSVSEQDEVARLKKRQKPKSPAAALWSLVVDDGEIELKSPE